MAKGGGRKYNRDKNGKFASTGGGGGGASKGGGNKAATTRKTNSARAADLKAKGTTAIGGRVKAKGFAGGKGAQERAGGLRSQKRIMYTGKGSGPRTSASMGTVGVSPRQVARVRVKASKPAPPATAKPAAKAAPKAPPKSRDRRASQMAAADVNNRRLEGRKLSGKGKTPMARANRNLERAMTAPSKNRVRSEKVARAAIDYYAANGGGGKKKRGKK